MIKNKYKEVGDLGLVAEQCREVQKTLFKPRSLTVCEVFNKFVAISREQGNKSSDRKKTIIKNLLVACKGNEARFLVRALQGNLRIKVAEKTIITALAHAMILTPPLTLDPNNVGKLSSDISLEQRLKMASKLLGQAYIEVPNHELVISKLLQYGIEVRSCVTIIHPNKKN